MQRSDRLPRACEASLARLGVDRLDLSLLHRRYGVLLAGTAYGFKRVIRLDARGELIRGLLEIDEAQADIVRRIYTEFAAGQSSILIAKGLNEDGIPGPRGGQWNASTIRGDPKKAVGILNNPLYVGRLVWGRRQWRRNPDSEMRERRYRLRDKSEWVEVAVPDLRIVDDRLWDAVHAEIEQRQRPQVDALLGRQNRKKHLLSGLIRCSVCGSNYTISGKDYYRCAGQKERGTCGNTFSVRKALVEHATLAVFRHHLFTPDHARIFADEFTRELDRLTRHAERHDDALSERLAVVTTEIANLGANMLAGVISETLTKLLVEREAEKQRLEAQIQLQPNIGTMSVPTPADLTTLFAAKAERLTETLNEENIRGEAAEILSRLIESVTIYPCEDGVAEAEVVARVEDLAAWAINDNAAPKGGVGRSMAVVAGTGFEPVTFRL